MFGLPKAAGGHQRVLPEHLHLVQQEDDRLLVATNAGLLPRGEDHHHPWTNTRKTSLLPRKRTTTTNLPRDPVAVANAVLLQLQVEVVPVVDLHPAREVLLPAEKEETWSLTDEDLPVEVPGTAKP